MTKFSISIHEVGTNEFLKIQIEDQNYIEDAKNAIQSINGVSKVNITKKNKDDLTVYPSKFADCNELINEIEIVLKKTLKQNINQPAISKVNMSRIDKGQLKTTIKKRYDTADKTNKQNSKSYLKWLIPFLVMLTGVFIFTPIRKILFGGSSPIVKHEESNTTGDIVQGDKNIYTSEAENELQQSREAQKQRCTDIFYNQQPKLDKALEDLKHNNLIGYSVLKKDISIEDIQSMKGLNNYVRVLNGFIDLYLTNILEGTEYNGYFLTEFERVSMAKLFCGNYEIQSMINFNSKLSSGNVIEIEKSTLKAIQINLKKFDQICSYNDLD